MSPVTRKDLESASFEYTTHYNMGRAGYGYGYRCVQHPRLSLIHRSFRPSKEEPDGKNTETLYVDGDEVADLDAAVARINIPPVLTEDETRILAMIPDEFVSLRTLKDELAGVDCPWGAIMPNTPHARVMDWLSSLAEKGMIEYGKNPNRDDGQPWSDIVPEHARYSPTVRRRPPPSQDG